MRHFFTLIAVMFLVCVRVDAQTGGVTLKGTVSETVTLSTLPNPDAQMAAVSNGSNRVRVTLSGDDPVIRVPLLVRSNSSFKVSANVESNEVGVVQLTVDDLRATGTLVSPHATKALDIKRPIDLDASQPVLVLTGPRVSLGGTLNSPNNALQLTLLIRIQPQPGVRPLVHLTFTATAEPLIQ